MPAATAMISLALSHCFSSGARVSSACRTSGNVSTNISCTLTGQTDTHPTSRFVLNNTTDPGANACRSHAATVWSSATLMTRPSSCPAAHSTEKVGACCASVSTADGSAPLRSNAGSMRHTHKIRSSYSDMSRRYSGENCTTSQTHALSCLLCAERD